MSNTYINPKLTEIIEEYKKENYSFRLFISGDTVLSRRTIINLNLFLNKHLENRYSIDIIDVLLYPEYTASEDIITLPLLIKDKPFPEARVTGDMSNTDVMIKEFLIV
jgi:circadian clock protein KaiB